MSESITKEKQEEIQKNNDEFFNLMYDVVEHIDKRIISEELTKGSYANDIVRELSKNKTDDKDIQKLMIRYKECEAKIITYKNNREMLIDTMHRNKNLLIVVSN